MDGYEWVEGKCKGYGRDMEVDTNHPWPQINVYHDARWMIYGDEGFQSAISHILEKESGQYAAIVFTEQGMQRDEMASMEPADDGSARVVLDYVKRMKGKY